MKKMKKIMVMVAALFAMSGCGPFIDNPEIENVRINDIILSADQLVDGKATLCVGETMQLKIQITPLHGVAQVIYMSTDELVAIVSKAGVVTAVGPGTVEIYAMADNDAAISDAITLNIVDSKVELVEDDKVDQAEAEARRR
jgi:uncharacterized protein YjdB